MVRFYLQKLVRDKVVPNCLDDPEVVHTEYRELDSQEFRRELVCKVHEEADEIPLGDKQRDEALKELADLQEVVDTLRQDFGFSIEQVQEAMARKKQKKGGFDNRHYIEYNDLVDDSKWVEIFRAQPEKYHEETAGSEEQEVGD
ncbi:nucleoside triphosphate pyrophosphohydrolase [Candidatus Nanosynbacter featherlites]|uniref:Phosphoribosyl-ATP pyrophosphohydrolase n=1 Tax=Candidatus Nanosynbacter featherlites TaxID=2572088 RepID=A0A4P9A3K6_9BACT|nr:nucleoside triphosphate pyrophosphohydrolase [Candidatus Nanosynbacter featherlites]QCT42379.1 phosphoribosyl-ATP pyrophosphohydrolase [Candidatus Nanosynbacter featherlites]